MHLRGDDRGQSIQIGAVLIFGIIIILLAFYQAFVVPAQNEEIDFDHYQEVERDMVTLRGEILQAKTTGEDRFATVRLGTQYPSRILARNPPDPSGSLRTSENKTLFVDSDGDGNNDLGNGLFDDTFSPANRFIEYRPRYAEFQGPGPIRYENTVAYKDFRNTNLTLTSQRLLRGDTISLIPMHREYQASGRQTASIEPVPGVLDTEEVEDPTVTVGTNLGEDDWEDLLEEEIANDASLTEGDITVTNGELTLDLTGTYDLEYAPVGLDRTPAGGVRGSDSTDINPAAPGDIELVAADWSGDTVTATFRNNADAGENNSFSRGRVAFYDRGGTKEVAEVRVNNVNRAQNTPWPIPGGFRELDPNAELPGDATTDVEIVFTESTNPQQEFFVLEFRLQSGETATYFLGDDFDNT